MGRARRADAPTANRPRWRRPWPWTPLGLVGLLSIAIGVRLIWSSAAKPTPLLDEGLCRIECVLDDAALVVKPGVKLRLTGIHDLGARAPNFIEEFIGEAPARLEFDKERIDSTGVYFGYVWVDERLLNEALVREGLARADTSARIASGMKTRLRRAETAARAAAGPRRSGSYANSDSENHWRRTRWRFQV